MSASSGLACNYVQRMPGSASTFARGVRLHNTGEFFAAHEAWEELWRSETRPDQRRFLQGLIQMTAAMHKLLVQRVPTSAERLLRRGLAKLEDHPATYEGIALGELREAARACADGIAELHGDAEGVDRFDRALVPVVRFASPPGSPKNVSRVGK